MNNQIEEKDGYYISFNPAPMIGNEGPETAIVFPDGDCRVFAILLGNHLQELSQKENLDQCLEYYHAHEDQHGSWTDV